MTTMLEIKKFEKGLWFTSRMSPQNCKFLFRFKKSKSPTKMVVHIVSINNVNNISSSLLEEAKLGEHYIVYTALSSSLLVAGSPLSAQDGKLPQDTCRSRGKKAKDSK